MSARGARPELLRFPAAVLVLLTACGAAWGAELHMKASLSRQLQQWVRFEVQGGRILPSSQFFGRSMNATTASNDRQEQLAMAVDAGVASVRHQLSTPEGELTLEADQRGLLTIRQVPRKPGAVMRLEFLQTPGDWIHFSVGEGDALARYRARSIWHLLIAHREVCREHLMPLLDSLRDDWNLLATAEQIEMAMIQTATAVDAQQRQRWAELVALLGAERYGVRERAERELRLAGPVVLGFLYHLDQRQLDAEQRYRVRQIIRSLVGASGGDSPMTVARGLIGDPLVWLALLDRPEAAHRRLAADRLAEILGEPIAFDPEADPTRRAAQIAQLQQRIEALLPNAELPAGQDESEPAQDESNAAETDNDGPAEDAPANGP